MTATADFLRTAGLRVTPGRVRVLDALQAASQPLSHADIEAQLPDADRVTLYRVLDSLVACGLAFKAVDARGVFCLKAAPPPQPKLPHGFRLGTVEFDISGVCAQCNQTKGSLHHGKS